MKQNYFTIAAVIAAVIVTIILYEPAALFVYKLREPFFKFPIALDKNKAVIRCDARGSGEFGAKRRNGRTHSGIDIVSAVGTPVYAAKSGIAFTGNIPHGYGKYIMMAHPDGFQTIYGHLSGWNVITAQCVRRGSLIGFVGKSGNAMAKSIQPHLHFEIRRRGEPVDPAGLLR